METKGSDPLFAAAASRWSSASFSAVERSGKLMHIVNTNCLAMFSSRAYNQIVITFDPAKRQANIDKHGIDLADCETVFDTPMLTKEDARESYGG